MLPAPGPFWGGNMQEKFEKRMMNFNELADYIGLKPQTIRNKFYAGEFPIPAKKIFSKVLWDKKDVDKYLDKLPKIDCWQHGREKHINPNRKGVMRGLFPALAPKKKGA